MCSSTAQVTELKAAANIPLSSRASDVDLESEFMGTRRRRPEEKQRDVIRRAEKERKEAQEVGRTEQYSTDYLFSYYSLREKNSNDLFTTGSTMHFTLTTV